MSELANIKHCSQCGNVMDTRRSTKKFCCGACRQAHWRGDEPVEMEEDEALELEIQYFMRKKRQEQP